MDANIEKLQSMIDNSSNIVFFGGAGVSTASGIPDFRSKDGLYNSNNNYDYEPEEMLSIQFFHDHTKEFFDFYRDKMLVVNYEPCITHRKLAELEKCGKLKAIVTQNIDGLHQKAGSRNVIELHGTIYSNHCILCKRKYGVEHIVNSVGVPKCEYCVEDNAIVKPDVVLYGEQLSKRSMDLAAKVISEADMLIVAGTSLSVYPAANFINYFNGDKLVLINKGSVTNNIIADLVIDEDMNYIFENIKC